MFSSAKAYTIANKRQPIAKLFVNYVYQYRFVSPTAISFQSVSPGVHIYTSTHYLAWVCLPFPKKPISSPHRIAPISTQILERAEDNPTHLYFLRLLPCEDTRGVWMTASDERLTIDPSIPIQMCKWSLLTSTSHLLFTRATYYIVHRIIDSKKQAYNTFTDLVVTLGLLSRSILGLNRTEDSSEVVIHDLMIVYALVHKAFLLSNSRTIVGVVHLVGESTILNQSELAQRVRHVCTLDIIDVESSIVIEDKGVQSREIYM